MRRKLPPETAWLGLDKFAATGAALDEINHLRGIIPICCSCKKIRDDDGYRQREDRDRGVSEQEEGSSSQCDQGCYLFGLDGFAVSGGPSTGDKEQPEAQAQCQTYQAQLEGHLSRERVEVADHLVREGLPFRTAHEKVGELVAIHVIPRPHANVDVTLPLGRQGGGGKTSKR